MSTEIFTRNPYQNVSRIVCRLWKEQTVLTNKKGQPGTSFWLLFWWRDMGGNSMSSSALVLSNWCTRPVHSLHPIGSSCPFLIKAWLFDIVYPNQDCFTANVEYWRHVKIFYFVMHGSTGFCCSCARLPSAWEPHDMYLFCKFSPMYRFIGPLLKSSGLMFRIQVFQFWYHCARWWSGANLPGSVLCPFPPFPGHNFLQSCLFSPLRSTITAKRYSTTK